MQWRRSDVFAVAEDLGLRDKRWLLRAILQSAGAPDDAASEASHMGRGGVLHADTRHRLSNALRLASERASPWPERFGVGRERWVGGLRRAALRSQRGARDRCRLLGREEGLRALD